MGSNGVVANTVEQDKYGRTLFIYIGSMFHDEGVAIQVLQKEQDGYSYVYDNDEYVYKYILKTERTVLRELSEQEKMNRYFSEDEISKVKKANDWDKPLDESKMFKVKISNMYDSEYKEEIHWKEKTNLKSVYGSEISNYKMTDKNGLSIYWSRTSRKVDIKTVVWNFITLTDEDYNVIAVEEIEDTDNCQEQIKEFKKKNGWCSLPFA